jgi:hypothetical protein
LGKNWEKITNIAIFNPNISPYLKKNHLAPYPELFGTSNSTFVPNFMLFLKSAHFSQYIAPYGWTIDPNL